MPIVNQRGSGTPVTSGTTWATVTSAVDGTPGTNPATYATWTNAVSGGVGYIEVSGYDFSSIPAGSTINSVTVTARHFESVTARFASFGYQAYAGATPLGSLRTGTLATAARDEVGTFPATLAQLQAGTFKVRATFTGVAATQSRVGSVDHLDVAVDYTAPPVSLSKTPADSAGGVDDATGDLAGPPPTGTYDDAVVADGAIHYWKFQDNPATNTAVDSIGGVTGNWSGTHTLGAAIAPGLGSSAQTPAGGSQVQTDWLPPPGGRPAPFTYEEWVSPSDATQRGNIVNAFGNIELYLGTDGTNYVLVTGRVTNIGGSVVAAISSGLTPPLSAGGRAHIVLVVEVGRWRLYVNGTQIDTNTFAGTAGFDAYLRFAISEAPWVGRFSNAAFYPLALSAAKVSAHYALGTAGSGTSAEATPADTAAGADAASVTSTDARTPADTAAGADALAYVRGQDRSPADTAAGADAATSLSLDARTPADTAAGADAANAVQTVPGWGLWDAALWDTELWGASGAEIPDDYANGTDAVSLTWTTFLPFTDLAGGVDAATAVTTAGANVVATPADLAAGSDAASLTRSVDRGPADTAAGADVATPQRAAGRSESPADAAAGSDGASTSADRQRAATDPAGGSDAATADLSGGGFTSKSPADLAAGSDALTVDASRVVSLADVATGSDNSGGGKARDLFPADTAAGSDALTRLWIRTADIDDPSIGSDTFDLKAVRIRTSIADIAYGEDAAVAAPPMLALVPGAARMAYGVDLRVQLAIARAADAGVWETSRWNAQVWGATDTSLGDWVDVTCDVATPFTLGAGASDADGVVTRWEAATCALGLYGDAWDPWGGPYAGVVGPGVGVRVLWRASTAKVTDPWLAAFTGLVPADGWAWQPGSQPHANVSATDSTQVLAAFDPMERSPIGLGETASQRVNRILDVGQWPVSLRDITSGGVKMKSTTMAEALWTQLLAVADTDLALMWVKRDGRLAFRPEGRVNVGTQLAGRLVVCDPSAAEIQVVTLGGPSFTDLRNIVSVSRQKDEDGPDATTVTVYDDASVARYLARAYSRTDLQHTDDAWSGTVANAILASSSWPTSAPREAEVSSLLGDPRVPQMLLGLEADMTFDVEDTAGQVWREACVGWQVVVGNDRIDGTVELSDISKWIGAKWNADTWDSGRWSFAVTVPALEEA